MDFFNSTATSIDMRDEIHRIIFGDIGVTGQGRTVILRRMTDQRCQGCFDDVQGGSTRPNCPYCKGEGYMFRETKEIMVIFAGVAPVYKPGILGTGQYPQTSYGYTDPNRSTAYCEFSVFPDYERYTFQTHTNYDKLYDLKVDDDGNLYHPLVRAAKWKILSVTPIHGDNGRVEFFELGMEKENVG